MISDLLEILKGFIGKRVRVCFYIGDGGGLHYFTEVGYIRDVSNHRVVLEPDPTVEDKSLTKMITLFTEFVAIYAVDELDPEKPIVEEEEKPKPSEYEDSADFISRPADEKPGGVTQQLISEGWVQVGYNATKNLIQLKRPKEPLKEESPEEFKEVETV